MNLLTYCQNREYIARAEVVRLFVHVICNRRYGEGDVLMSGEVSDDTKNARNTECISDISQYAWCLALMGRRNDCGGVAEDPCIQGSEVLFRSIGW
jgi:hypothetical protein